jgi:hypothetical protein
LSVLELLHDFGARFGALKSAGVDVRECLLREDGTGGEYGGGGCDQVFDVHDFSKIPRIDESGLGGSGKAAGRRARSR